ncbi:TadE family type IV pilus minor pilin [Amycolatopsis tolypomycina]|uniref:TadE family type IV pilus minor pilin n=1 Tax=Amycolatopsis tolypomycina TaxID=208445 RepID=UPI000B83C9E9|nr:TadE family type IV pilus minor pilin [Amycolatopsis tolypomycina]
MTVEAALGLMVLTAVMVLLLAALTVLTIQLRCTDAAREAARLLARGQAAEAAAAVHEIGPPGATLTVEHTEDRIRATVAAHPAAAGLLPEIHLDATAYAVAEPNPEVADAQG